MDAEKRVGMGLPPWNRTEAAVEKISKLQLQVCFQSIIEPGSDYMKNAHTVVACIPTCNRPEGLDRCVMELDRSTLDESYKLAIIIVDNSYDANAAALCRKLEKKIQTKLCYVHEIRKGIPFARNAAIKEALKLHCTFIAFIDDDEYPHKDWLNTLLNFSLKNNAKIVSGPVIPIYENGFDTALSESGVYSRPRYATGTKIRHFATNNLLLNHTLFSEYNLRFNEDMSLCGGTDTDFSIQTALRGIDCVWCDEATVYESVPITRGSFKWLFLRGFRGGANYSRFRKKYRLCRNPIITSLLTGFVRIIIGLFHTLISFGISKGHLIRGIKNISTGTGLILGIFNIAYNEYASTHRNQCY